MNVWCNDKGFMYGLTIEEMAEPHRSPDKSGELGFCPTLNKSKANIILFRNLFGFFGDENHFRGIVDERGFVEIAE